MPQSIALVIVPSPALPCFVRWKTPRITIIRPIIKVIIKKVSSKNAITSTLLAEPMPFENILKIRSELIKMTPTTKRITPPIMADAVPPCFCGSSKNSHFIDQIIKITPATLSIGINSVKNESIRPPA